MIKRMLYMNGLAILAVVLNHARVWGIVAMVSWADRYSPVTVPNYDQIGSLVYYLLLSVEGIIQSAIPTFLFVSGFFIAVATGRNKSTIPWNIVFTRIKFLVIPYSLWFIIICVLRFVEGVTFPVTEYLRLFFTGGIKGPFYFVPLLVQYYLLSPFIVPFAKTKWKPLLIIIVLIQLSTQILLYLNFFQIVSSFSQYYVLPAWLFPTRILWFVLGIIVGSQLQSFKEKLARIKWAFIPLIILFLVAATIERDIMFRTQIEIPVETTIGSLYALSCIFAILGFSNVQLPLTDPFEKIGSKSFGIYLTHASVQEYTSRVIYHIAPGLLGYQLVFVLILTIVGLGLPILLMEIVQRSPLRRYYQLIFG